MSALPELIDQDHRKRYIADCKRAAALGLSVDAYQTQRADAIARWTKTIRTLMDEHHVDDPVEVLPGIIAGIEEQMRGDAKAAAEVAARVEIQKLLRKATAS